MTHTKVHSVLFGLVLGAWAAQAGAADSLSDSQCSQLITRGFSDAVGTDVTLQSAEIWTLLTKVETSCDRILIAGGANVEAEWEQGPAV